MPELGDAARETWNRTPLVLDGAVGTELERRGLGAPGPLWSAAALLDSPGVVRDIHAEHVAAGADIVVADTFRTNVRTLRAAQLLDRAEDLNRRAVVLARQAADGAADRSVIVAASVAPVEDCYSPHLVPEEPALSLEHELMMKWLRQAGANVAWCETMNTAREARVAAEAAVSVGLPFVVSVVTAESGDLLGGDTLRAFVEAVEPLAPLAIGLNCIPPRGVSALLPRLRDLTSRRIVVYAHIGNEHPTPGWSYSEVDVSPEQYGEYVEKWRDMGAEIIGGCCGTTAEHVRVVADVLKNIDGESF